MNGPGTELVVTFDEALVTDPAAATVLWGIRYNNFEYTVSAVALSALTATLTCAQAGADAGADVVTYTGSPGDLITLLSDLLVLPFSNFPIT